MLSQGLFHVPALPHIQAAVFLPGNEVPVDIAGAEHGLNFDVFFRPEDTFFARQGFSAAGLAGPKLDLGYYRTKYSVSGDIPVRNS